MPKIFFSEEMEVINIAYLIARIINVALQEYYGPKCIKPASALNQYINKQYIFES